jgi:ferredoxin
MAKRKIITIDEEKCNGCKQCIPNCPEGALQIIDGKARLISDLCCDGLGACIGHCPQAAITIEEREAQKYDEAKVMENIVKQGSNVIKAHLKHLKDHGEKTYLKEAEEFLAKRHIQLPKDKEPSHEAYNCPGGKMIDMRTDTKANLKGNVARETELRQWPVQIMLVSPHAPYFEGADLLIAADCVPFAYPSFHEDLLAGKSLLVGCPKLDDIEVYKEKITEIVADNNIKSITYAHMEVPCCSGLIGIIESAISDSKKKIPFHDVTIGIKGDRK